MKKLFLAVMLVSMLVTVPVFAQDSAPNIVEISSTNFVTLTAAVEAAGLADTLSGGEFTVFAPTDGAFQTLLNDLDLSVDDLLANKTLLEGVLTYHVIPGTVTANDILNGSPDGTTVNGAALSFGYDDTISRVSINGGAATVIAADIAASNGIVHVIDNVLLPPNVGELLSNPAIEATETTINKSILDISKESFVVLTAAVDAAGLSDTLSSGEFTVFAPTDGAFQTLLNDLGISQAELLANKSLLTDVLTYHVIPGTVTANDILNGSPDGTTVNGETLSFGYDDTISRVSINGGDATVVAPNLFASNGVVHIIDNVLLP